MFRIRSRSLTALVAAVLMSAGVLVTASSLPATADVAGTCCWVPR